MHPDWSRYSCQMALPGFDEAAQTRLQAARILIVGAGGLGCPAAQYLTSSGIGTLGIADFDTIAVSNLHRQILYNTDDVGQSKADTACTRLKKQNPDVRLIPHTEKITSDNIFQIIDNYDIIVDCTDNFDTRYLINDAAVLTGKPVIYGAIYQFEGQIAVWNFKKSDDSYSTNYRDLYPEVNAAQIPDCATGGVIPTLAGIIGCMQANEAIKCIIQTGALLAGKLLIFDARTMQSRIIKMSNVTKTNITTLQPTLSASTITFNELQKGLSDHTLQLIDVRSARERDTYDIGGEHIPLDELEENLHIFTSSAKFVFYCASGKRSAEAVKMIKEKIPTANVFSLESGISNH